MPHDLSVIIPFYDSAKHLESVTKAALAADLAVEVVLVDDGSTDGGGEIADRLAAECDDVIALHQDNQGAGVARNVGFAEASGRYVLFFDVDDELHSDVLKPLVSALDGGAHDLAFTPYSYRRGHSQLIHMNLEDIEVWDEIMNGADQISCVLADAPRLLGFSNYPWNKILRTSRYREVGLRFGSTKVNNDILGHWHALLFARSMLLDRREICTHIVPPTGGNLTNQHGRSRLSMFDALAETYDLLAAHPELRNRYNHFYWSLVIRLSNWARNRIADDLQQEFSARLQELLLRIDLTDFTRLRLRRDPALATAIINASFR